MNYELSKQLFEAKYPYKGVWCKYPEGGDLLFPKPTLSELIESCSPKFASLVKSQTNWMAMSTKSNIGVGDTPEEAVARLWLELK